MTSSFYLELAIHEAWRQQGLTYPNPSVGALIQDENGAILSLSTTSQTVGFPHAEVEAIKQAFIKLTSNKQIEKLQKSDEIHEYLLKNHNNIFKDFTLTVTLEPCNHFGATPPCSNLIVELGFKKVVIGVKDINTVASGAIIYLEKNGVCVELLDTKKAKDLVFPFFKWNQDRFIFFKFAFNLNGSYEGQVSSEKTREFMHELRNKVDLIVIGGNTVRVDRPTLDARFSKQNNAPDVLIYSKTKDFDESIPLFDVKKRKVYIEDNFDLLQNYNFIMIEGGEKMMEATKNIVDAYLFLQSYKINIGTNFNANLNIERLYSIENGEDTFLWYKNQKNF